MDRRSCAGIALLCAASCAPEPRAADTACRGELVGLALGVQQGKVGQNLLPVAIFCGTRSGEPAPRALYLMADFRHVSAPPGTPPTPSEMLYLPSPRSPDSSPLSLHFDYRINVRLDRPGIWMIHLRTRVPWRSEEAETTMMLPVVAEAQP